MPSGGQLQVGFSPWKWAAHAKLSHITIWGEPMSATLKIKYVGTGEWDAYPDLVFDKVYTSLAVTVHAFNNIQVLILGESNELKAVSGFDHPEVWTLVSATYPGEVTLFPGA
jgi:hypothetical protein